MDKGKTYKTTDGNLWFCVGKAKQTPICVDWMGELKRLSRRYRKNAIKDTWDNWLKQHKYFWLNVVVLGNEQKFTKSVNEILTYLDKF